MIGVILNPNAENNRNGKIDRDRLESIVKDYGIFRETKDKDQSIKDALMEFKEANVSTITPIGGDGTMYHLLEALVKIYNLDENPSDKLPTLMPIKAGSINMTANTLNKLKDPYKILQFVIDHKKSGKELNSIGIKPLQVGATNPKFGFVFTQGITYKFLERYYDNFQEVDENKAWKMLRKGYLNKSYREEFFDIQDFSVCVNGGIEYANILLASVIKPKINFGKFSFEPFKELNSELYLGYGKINSNMARNLMWSMIFGKKSNNIKYLENVKNFMTYAIKPDNKHYFSLDGELIDGLSTIIPIKRADFYIKLGPLI